MNTHKLKPALEFILTAPTNVDGVDSQLDAAWAIYDSEVTPSAVLSLISDNERMKASNETAITNFDIWMPDGLTATEAREWMAEGAEKMREEKNP